MLSRHLSYQYITGNSRLEGRLIVSLSTRRNLLQSSATPARKNHSAIYNRGHRQPDLGKAALNSPTAVYESEMLRVWTGRRRLQVFASSIPLSKLRSHRERRYERSKEHTKGGTLPVSLFRKGCRSDRARRDGAVRPLVEAGSKVSARAPTLGVSEVENPHLSGGENVKL